MCNMLYLSMGVDLYLFLICFFCPERLCFFCLLYLQRLRSHCSIVTDIGELSSARLIAIARGLLVLVYNNNVSIQWRLLLQQLCLTYAHGHECRGRT